MGFFSAVGDFVSSIVTKAVSVGSVIAPIVGKLCTNLSTALSIVANIVRIVGIILEVLKPQEKIDDLGEKVIQAEEKGLTLEKCDNDFEKYAQRIRDFEIDPEKAKKHTIEDKYAAGIAFVQTGIEQKAPLLRLDAMYPLIVLKSDFFNESRMKSYVQTSMDMGYGLDKLKGYLDGSCSMGEKAKAESFIQTAEQKINPSFDKNAFERQLADVKYAARS